MAFHRPGRPPNGIPSARARGFPPGVTRCGSGVLAMMIRVVLSSSAVAWISTNGEPWAFDVSAETFGKCLKQLH